MSTEAAPQPLAEHSRPNLFEIDLGAIAALARNIRKLVGPEAKIFAALKCNAYGFGLVPVARTVTRAGVDAISVVDRADAIALREAGISAPILVYPGSLADAAAVSAVESYGLIPTLVDLASAETYSRLATRPIEVAVKVDTGQERLGFPAEEAAEAIAAISRMPRLKVRIVNSHPNVPTPPSLDYLNWQFQRFEAMCRKLQALGIEIPIRMVASSKILSVLGRLAFNAVDPGQMFFGPFREEGDVPWPTARRPLRKISSRLIHIRSLARTEFTKEAPFPVRPGTRMGVIPMGSADGGARLHAGEVLVRGRRAKFLSGASLEHMRVDLTEIPEAELGDEVVFVGEQGREAIAAEAVVEHQNLQRITDIAMAVGPRIPRRYLEAE